MEKFWKDDGQSTLGIEYLANSTLRKEGKISREWQER